MLPVERVLELVHQTGGCDAKDEYSRGWDEACNELYRQVAGMLPEMEVQDGVQ